ncbi:specifically androgen-regulated gene protein [Alosa sapidissima]|uniref:specifically androgen-regulated gene protein n=1 Tax=Alosa sapidissima TaxID=34773 RepID=UPI001C08070C|nr:specifically androgen-regulated gene protein [Alosa sapidissima]XP_041944046.1 specifically androgen-regulated gene protein [Alosa sapidissima]XP_041944047.1 specifically androgen-regulated gene protein [Alosa sapidissima]
MPRSDTWLGGVVLDTMREMDSAGSCDSVVSFNSGFSDDSLEHLSAEERACLMFLEETIEALETEEDSGLSNDEPDAVPAPGNLVTRMANLSASMSHSKKKNEVSICHKAEPVNRISKDHNQILNYLVPTPLVLASGSTNVLSKPRRGFTPKGGSSPKKTMPAVTSKAPPAHPTIPSEVNVVVIPPPLKETSSPARATDHPAPGEQRLAECASPRGPLSYEGLVQLRKAASMKKAQEASHTTQSQAKQPAKPIKQILLDDGSPHAQSDQYGVRKPSPPTVAPKPKKIPSNIPTSPQTDKTVMDPKKVRMEALYKLGLLKDQEASTTPHQSKWVRPPTCPPPPPPPHPPPDPCSVPEPPFCKPPPVPTTVALKTRQTHWTSGGVHHRSLSDATSGAQQLSVKPVAGKAATLERSGPGMGSSLSSHTVSDSGYRDSKNNPPEWTNNNNNSVLHNCKPRSSTLDMRKDCKDSGQRDGGSSAQWKSLESGVKRPVLSQPVPHSGLMLPRMGEDRREALRKLGLLKD